MEAIVFIILHIYFLQLSGFENSPVVAGKYSVTWRIKINDTQAKILGLYNLDIPQFKLGYEF